MDFLKKLRLPDYISLIGLLFTWLSILLLIDDFVTLAIITNFIAFLLDLADGYAARKLQASSSLGRAIDSAVDVFTYLIFPSMLYFKYLAPNIYFGVIGSFTIIFFGLLRLIRFNLQGILADKKGNYYAGLTVVHISVIVLLCYLSQRLLGIIPGIVTTMAIFIMSPLMLSNFKSYKHNSVYYAIFGLILLIFILYLSYDH